MVKVVSGLPYGTHVAKITCTSSGSNPPSISRFLVYQPKKPSLPNSAIELADYNVLADYVSNSSASIDSIATGVIRKHPAREFNYTGSSWSIDSLNTDTIGGLLVSSNGNPKSMSYTFFGTGFDLRFSAGTNRSSAIAVSLNGLALNGTNYPSAASFGYGAGSAFNPSTGVLTQFGTSTVEGCGFRCSGLPIGLYTLNLSDASSNYIAVNAIDIISPIHSFKVNAASPVQNELLVGSQSILDKRKFTPMKDSDITPARWARATAPTGSSTTTSSNYVPVPGLSLTFESTGKPVKIDAFMSVWNNTSGAQAYLALYIDGEIVGRENLVQAASYSNSSISMSHIENLTAGIHRIEIHWKTNGGNTTALQAGEEGQGAMGEVVVHEIT